MLSPGGYVRQGSKNGGQAARAVNVQVAVRCRPLNDRERAGGDRSIVKCDIDRREIHFTPPVGRKAPAGGSNGKKTFTYDHVFGPNASQQDVYEGVVEPIVDEVLQGYNCTVFAYGQTGTGKTHTMEGRRDESTVHASEKRLPQNAGMIPRAVKQVFDHLRSITDDHSVRVSHLELYNEQLTDLLGPEEENGDLRMYEDAQKGTFVNGLDEIVVRSEEEIFEILDKSAIKRKTAETLMNKFSSRSHSVFSITIHIKESGPDGTDLLKVGKLNLVDLAGSENVGRSGAVKGRAREAGNINQSLLTLGRVITALVEHHPHIPYRDSKLTRLLQESLGGRNKTCVIATATIGSSSYEETLSTLDYAYRAKSIKNRPTVNQMVAKHVCSRSTRTKLRSSSANSKQIVRRTAYTCLPTSLKNSNCGLRTRVKLFLILKNSKQNTKKVTAELKEKLDQTQNALYRSHRDLQKKEEELSITHSKLADETGAKLGALQERDEERYIVSKYARTEEDNHSQIRTLQGTIEKSVQDVNSLQIRVAEKHRLEKENIRSTEELRDAVSEGARALRTALRTYETNHDSQLRATQSKVGDIVADVGSGLSQISKHLKSLRSHMDDLQEVHGEDATKFEDGVVESCAAFSDSVNNSIQAQVARLSAVKEDVTSACESVDGVLSKLSQDIQALSANFKIFDTKQASMVRDMVNATKNGLDGLSSDIAACMKAHEVELSVLQSRLEASFQRQTKQAENAKSDVMAQVGLLLDAFVQENKDASKVELELAKTSIAKSKEESQKKTEEVSKSCEEIAGKVDDFQINVRNERAKIGSSVSCTAAESSESASLCKRIVEGQSHRVADLISEATQNELKLQANISQHCTETSDNVQSRTVKRLEEESAKRELIKEGEDNLLGRISATGSQVTQLSEFLSENITQQRRLITDSCIGTAHVLDTTISEPVKVFEIEQDAGHGETPEERDWKYPTDVKMTKSRSTLIAEYHDTLGKPILGSPASAISGNENAVVVEDIPRDSASEAPSEEDFTTDTIKHNAENEKSAEEHSYSSTTSVASHVASSTTNEDNSETSAPAPREVLRDDTNIVMPNSANITTNRKKRTGKPRGIRPPRVLSTSTRRNPS